MAFKLEGQRHCINLASHVWEFKRRCKRSTGIRRRFIYIAESIFVYLNILGAL